MAFNNGYTAVTGATYTAAQYNTHTRDNFTAIWVYTTAGDIAYATSNTTLARLAIGANGYYMTSNGSAPVWTAFYRHMQWMLNKDIALNIGDDAIRFHIVAAINGWNIALVSASRKSGGTGTLTIQIRNVTDAVDVLSTKLTVPTGQVHSSAGTPAVIDTSKDDVATNDILAIDVDDPGTNTYNATADIGFLKP